MSGEGFDLQAYLAGGVENIVKSAVKATFSNPGESAFMASFALASREASRKRAKLAEQGSNIPAFLIASITGSCNLHCQGCFTRYAQDCSDDIPEDRMTAEDWERIFAEARELGISFIILAGGEPLLRRKVIEAAGRYPQIIFPVFTNGIFIDDEYMELFERNRNLLPVISMEGGKRSTDERRGPGVYDLVRKGMENLRERRLIFGTSITVTGENLREVTAGDFLDDLRDSGCKAVIYVEYVPVTEESRELAPGDGERKFLEERLALIRREYEDMVFISFPGDEKASGGCLAAGRGFFHINPRGSAEPCPFSPYSDMDVKNSSLREALDSPLFRELRRRDVLTEDHSGGCVLFEKQDEVKAILNGGAGDDL